MGGVPGHPKHGGRTKGTPNKVTFDLMQILRDRNFEPAAKLVETHSLAMQDFERHEENRKETEKRINEDSTTKVKVGMSDDAREALKVASDAAAKLMQYTHPKRKAIEHTGANGEPLEMKPVVIYIPDNGRSKRD